MTVLAAWDAHTYGLEAAALAAYLLSGFLFLVVAARWYLPAIGFTVVFWIGAVIFIGDITSHAVSR